MTFAKNGLAAQGADIGRSVLSLSALGLFAKLLHIDLGQLQILGVALKPASAGLIPGFIGLALLYAYLAFIVARLEAAIEDHTRSDSIEARLAIKESKPLRVVSYLALPFSAVVYATPYIVGAASIRLLWTDTAAVASSIFSLAAR